jgi:hypothetical protein
VVVAELGPCRDSDDFVFLGSEAEELDDVIGHLGKAVAAELPRLIEVIEPVETGALVADG